MDLQLTTAEAHIVRDALDEFVTLRVDALKRADGSPGHCKLAAAALVDSVVDPPVSGDR